MKIYLSHSSGYDFESELYAPLKSSSIVREHEIFFPHDKESVDTNSKSLIAHGDWVIAEVSYPSTGQGIELGWANDANTSVLCVYKSGSKISSSLKFITDQFIEYKDVDEMLDKLSDWLITKK